jgi:hypothetical protein
MPYGRIVTLNQGIGVVWKIEMKRDFVIALFLASCLVAVPRLFAQAPAPSQTPASNRPAGSQNKPDGAAQKPPAAQPQSGANLFPTDTSSVPVMPSTVPPDLPPGTYGSDNDRIALPSEDLDPVRTPDDKGAAESDGQSQYSSSDVSGLDSLLPKPGDDGTGKRKRDVEVPEHQETSKEDISVGKYYLDNKNWKAALSRFQSALVLAPDEPEVYWGLAESERHLGNFADARANYMKVIEYDPGSRHAKDSQKALKDPEIANAKVTPAGQSSTATPR